MLLRDFAALCRALEETRGRLEKRRLVAEYLAAPTEDHLPHTVAFLTGRAFAVCDPRTLCVRGLRNDKGQGQATTLAELGWRYEGQFHRKGRAE